MLEQLTALLAASLGGGAAILVLLTLGPLLTRKVSPHWRYWAWAVVAVSLMAYPILGPVLGALFPAPIQLDVPQMVAHGAYDRYNAYHLDNQRIVEAGAGGAGGTNTYVDGEQMWYSHHVHYTDRQGREVSIRDNDYLRTVTVEGVTSYTVHWTGVIYGAYRGVAVLFLLWMAAGYGLGRRRLLRWSTPAGEEDLAALERARQETGCRKKASLYRCPKAGSPLLLGFAHPVILLPETLQEGGREAALAHELTHLKRRDTGYLLLLTCVRCIHWFNPLVWNMVRTARRDMELCCDDDLLAGRDRGGPPGLRPGDPGPDDRRKRGEDRSDYRLYWGPGRDLSPVSGHHGHHAKEEGTPAAGLCLHPDPPGRGTGKLCARRGREQRRRVGTVGSGRGTRGDAALGRAV